MSTSVAGFSRRTGTIIGRTLIGLLWLLALVMAGAAGLEFLLRIRSHWRPPEARTDRPRFDQLDHAYQPSDIFRLHPQYLFFFPLDPHERVALSNETCSIDADGFRGPGPAHAGGRRLAFLLGGSAAFGYMASSDATTITGYLNQLQDAYFFVNAGASGWNSTQELFRVAFQILDYHPALVVTFDGANDARLLEDQYNKRPGHDPIGTPEHFSDLEALIDQRPPVLARRVVVSVMETLLPQLSDRIQARLQSADHGAGAAPPSQETIPEGVVEAGADRYLSNLARIRDLTTADGARFLAVFQPMAELHRHLGPGMSLDDSKALVEFHQRVLMKYRHDFEFRDLGNVFDQYYATIPVMTGDITDATVFVDDVHLYDPGNAIVARELSRIIGQLPSLRRMNGRPETPGPRRVESDKLDGTDQSR